jgi:hypothetical protein
MMFLLLGIGWGSHLVLDMVVHRTPLFYPLSDVMMGYAPARVYEGGLFYYLTDPIFLLEPLLFAVAACHWLVVHTEKGKRRVLGLVGIVSAFMLGSLAFLLALPMLQNGLAV